MGGIPAICITRTPSSRRPTQRDRATIPRNRAYIAVPAFGRGRNAVGRRADQARRTSADPAVGTFDAVLAIVRDALAAAALSGSILTERVICAGGPPGFLFVRSAVGVIVKVGAAVARDNQRISA